MAVFLFGKRKPDAKRAAKARSLFVLNGGNNFLPVAKAYGRSPKNMRRYSKRKAVVEAEGRPPLQARDHMANSASHNSRSSARDGLERSRRRACAFALFS
jgi:hypothetical protein